MVQVSIEYDKPQYSPGDTVCARVSVEVVQSCAKICCIKISSIGCALVKWEESQSKNSTKRFSSTHTYFSRSEFLLPPPEEGNTMFLSVGRHSYQYKFILPLTCDSSSRYGFGKIKYKCYVEVIRPFRPLRTNTRAKKEFTVHRPVDLLQLSCLPSPVTKTLETRFLPFKKGSITMKGSIECASYLPGQRISVDTSIYNNSPRVISEFNLRLVEERTFIAFYHSRAYQKVKKERLVNMFQPLQVARGSDYFYSHELEIPLFTPIHNTCSYIKVKYYLKLEISTSTLFSTSLSLKIPVVIGTIPTSHSNPTRKSIASLEEDNNSRRDRRESSDSSFYYLSEDSIDVEDFTKYNDRSNLLH